jgi:hypothetical protein
VTSSRNSFKQNPGFNLGPFSLFLSVVALLWLLFATAILLFPTETDPVKGITWDNLNYTPVILFLSLTICLGFWCLPYPVGAKHHFKGSKLSILPSL